MVMGRRRGRDRRGTFLFGCWASCLALCGFGGVGSMLLGCCYELGVVGEMV